jgi:hypothetical protein
MRRASKLALALKPIRGPDLGSWEQAGQAIREMAELQVQINQERAKCDAMIEGLKRDLADKLKPLIFRRSRFELMIERFIKRSRRDCKRKYKQFRFGSVSFARNKIDIRVDVEAAAERLGKP